MSRVSSLSMKPQAVFSISKTISEQRNIKLIWMSSVLGVSSSWVDISWLRRKWLPPTSVYRYIAPFIHPCLQKHRVYGNVSLVNRIPISEDIAHGVTNGY